MGYARAGFDVVGVDIKPQVHYPFEFHQGDAMTWPLEGFDAIHASPPCQRYSALSNATGNAQAHPDLIEAIRTRLVNSERPYAIENVERAPLLGPVTLCGTMFGLPILRHRLFEMCCSPILRVQCSHNGSTIDGTYVGHAEDGHTRHGQQRPNWSHKERQQAMGIDWMTRNELREAIPPAYTEWIGQQLLRALKAPA